jgi:hypothetical protein
MPAGQVCSWICWCWIAGLSPFVAPRDGIDEPQAAAYRLLTGQESRQQLYTMLTRGHHTNHLYLQVVGDGDPPSLIRPDTISPRTPSETRQQILARDDTPVSANTVLRELNNPAARLLHAVRCYTDSLHVAAEQLVGPEAVAELDQADQYLPDSPMNPPGQPCEHTSSTWRPNR